MLIEQGKRLISVMEYAHSLMPMNFPDDESWINRYGIVSELGVDLLMPVATSADRYRFMPGPEFPPRLYRGQNQFSQRARLRSSGWRMTLMPFTGQAKVSSFSGDGSASGNK